jgi:hypothetical protein
MSIQLFDSKVVTEFIITFFIYTYLEEKRAESAARKRLNDKKSK